MFYGCLPYETRDRKDFCPVELAASLECCKNLDDRSKSVSLQDITIGKWAIHTNFYVVNLCFDNAHLGHNFSLKESNSKFIKTINETYSKNASNYILTLLKYYSELCSISSNGNAYYILTALFLAITNYYDDELNMKVHGLISPSAMTKSEGLNIVMAPDSVDEFLTLDKVGMVRYFLVKPEKEIYAAYYCTEAIENFENEKDFSFQFKNYIKPAPRFLSSMKI